MGLRRRYQVGIKQREKRKKKRDKLAAKGLKPADFLYGKFYLKSEEKG